MGGRLEGVDVDGQNREVALLDPDADAPPSGMPLQNIGLGVGLNANHKITAFPEATKRP
jgi:hypothetical protein